jgi:hypothetical protein
MAHAAEECSPFVQVPRRLMAAILPVDLAQRCGRLRR